MQKRFGEIMERYKDFIYSYTYYFSGSRENAEDLTQEVLLRIWQNMGSIKLGPTKSWVSKVTRNLCIDWTRRKHSPLDASVPLENLDSRPETGPHRAEELLEEKELRERLRGAIARLPERYRSLIILREIEHLKYEEISDTLEMPLNSVKVNIHRARRLLRESLKPLYENQMIRR
jgi:RNA polymerase sigma-70 factor (ECF subfamily)